MPSGLFAFWRRCIFSVELQPVYGVTQKAACFELGSEQEKALQQVQDAVQAALPLGRFDPADQRCLKWPWS